MSPEFNKVVVHFLNHRFEEATVYKNSEITSIEILKEADLPATAVGCIEKGQPSPDQEPVLWDVVQGYSSELDQIQKDFYQFLL